VTSRVVVTHENTFKKKELQGGASSDKKEEIITDAETEPHFWE